MRTYLLVVMITIMIMMMNQAEASITCYTCGPGIEGAEVTENGTCSKPHFSKFCENTDWCVKTWSGSDEDNLKGICSLLPSRKSFRHCLSCPLSFDCTEWLSDKAAIA